MSETDKTDKTDTLIPAATILLLRDGASGVEVFMVERHHRIDFASGALVFPGGRVDADDSAPEMLARCAGRGALSDAECCVRAAAIREAFEESGILYARAAGERDLLPQTRATALAPHREELAGHRLAFSEFLAREALELACDNLVPYAHWITPKMMPKRFDTYFYAAVAPGGQVGSHDGYESTDSVWIRPEDALKAGDDGTRQVIFPTRMNLALLTGFASTEDALKDIAARRIVTVEPEVTHAGGTPILRIPKEAGYPVNEIPIDKAG